MIIGQMFGVKVNNLKELTKMLDKLKKLINDGTITVGQEDSLYDSGTPVLIGQEYLSTVEGFRVDADPISLAERKYQVIVDFSFLNLTDKIYFSDLSRSVLSDGEENYSPIKVTNTEEDARFKRFDLVFVVPVSSRVFELTFNTGLDIIGEIRYKVDVNSLADRIETEIPGGCMFIINDDPVEVITIQ